MFLAIQLTLLGLGGLVTASALAASPGPDVSEKEMTARSSLVVGPRHRVVVLTDIGGTDPDDFQSLVHLLLYADVLDIEGLVSSPYGPGRRRDILKVVECYASDYINLRRYSAHYPRPEALQRITVQGETEAAPYAGVRRTTEGSQWLVHCARREDPRPLHVLVWGGLEDLAQALHDAPDILPRLRVYWIGGPNKKWSPDAYEYIATHHSNLRMIEANATYRGWFTGGIQSESWGNRVFAAQHIAGKGALGEFFSTQLGGILKMGDSPSVGWLLRGVTEDPSQPGWGGQFVRAWERPYARFERLTTPADRIEVFGILELVLPLDGARADRPEARLIVENQSLPGYNPGDGTVRFRFCPKAAKMYRFEVHSNLSTLDGKTGGVTAFTPSPDMASRPSPKHPNWWTDDPSPEFFEGEHMGARTVNRWRQAYLLDFSERMDRCRSKAQ